jgi:hypothetical protein
MILFSTNQKNHPFCKLFLWLPKDPYVVLSPTRGAAGGDGFWVQPFGDGSSGFIQPVRLADA